MLLKLDNKEEATEYFSKIFGDGVNSDAANLRMQVEDHPNAYSIEESLSLEAGIAYAFYAIADILKDDADPNTALLYVRLAQYLNENSQKAILLAADLLEQMGQYDLAVKSMQKFLHQALIF